MPGGLSYDGNEYEIREFCIEEGDNTPPEVAGIIARTRIVIRRTDILKFIFIR